MQREVESLFHELADLSSDQREAYFRDRSVPDGLRAEVEALLQFDTADDLLTNPVAASAEQLLEPRDGIEDLRCGPYQLIRVLGRGG
jgi:hypothetical protein